MLKEIENHRADIAELCRRYGVKRLELFGSAARGEDFDPATSDIDFLVEFSEVQIPSLNEYLALQEALGELLGRPVELMGRNTLERSRNYIRRRSILRDAQPVYG